MRDGAITIGGFLCAALIVAATVVTEKGRHDEAIHVAERDVGNAARLAAEHGVQAFSNVLASLQGVKSIREDVLKGRIRGRTSVSKLLDSVRGDAAVIHSLGWTDADGLQVGRSSNGGRPSSKPVNMSRREHFRFFRDVAKPGERRRMHISSPIQARATGQWILILSVGLEDDAGRFAGVAGAAVDPLYFASVYGRIELGPSRIATLYRSDGVVLARSPDATAWIGKHDVAAEDAIRDALAHPATGVRGYETAEDGSVRRIVRYRAVGDLPLVVAVSLSMDDALAPFHGELRIMVVAVTLVILVLLGATFLASMHFQTRRRSQAALMASEERYRVLTELSPVGVFEADDEGRCTYVNARWSQYAGLSEAQALGDGWIAALHPEDRDRVIADWRRDVAQNDLRSLEFRFQAPDGTVTWLLGQVQAVADADGRTIGQIGTLTDTTQRRQAEEALARASKIEAIGQLSGGVAHDVNNMLGIILTQAELLQPLVAGNAKARKCVEAVIRGVNRGAGLTRRLLRFSRVQAHEAKRISANDVIRDMADLLARSLTPVIQIETMFDDAVWPVEVDAGELEDSVLNLALNARDAMPDGGKLVVETANKILDERYAERNPGSAAGEFVMISVSDTGAGMSRDVAEKAFEPFFTTKEVGQGTGLGLSMVYGFILRSGGHAKIYSEPGAGTTVRLYLPRALGEAEAVLSSKAVVVPRGEETILIVDDEPALAEAAEAILQSLGYRTTTADRGARALEVLRSDPSIDMLFSDVIMPGAMDGYQLAIRALAERPGLRILLTSGFTQRREECANGGHGPVSTLARNLLHKPYNTFELASAVRRALDGDPPTAE